MTLTLQIFLFEALRQAQGWPWWAWLVALLLVALELKVMADE